MKALAREVRVGDLVELHPDHWPACKQNMHRVLDIVFGAGLFNEPVLRFYVQVPTNHTTDIIELKPDEILDMEPAPESNRAWYTDCPRCRLYWHLADPEDKPKHKCSFCKQRQAVDIREHTQIDNG